MLFKEERLVMAGDQGFNSI